MIGRPPRQRDPRRDECDLFDEAAFAYVHRLERSRRLRARGQCDKADDALASAQEVANCIHVTEISRAWREDAAEVRT